MTQKRAVFQDADMLWEIGARSRFALDRDVVRYASTVAADSASGFLGYLAARRVGDLTSAEAALARYAQTGRGEDITDTSRPLSLFHAQLAYIQGRREDARRFSSESLAELSNATPAARQAPAHLTWTAMARAYAGESDAVEQVEQAFRSIMARDRFQAINQGIFVAETLIALGRNDRALDYLQQSVAVGAAITAAELGSDPLWAPLRGERRFAQILKQLQPR